MAAALGHAARRLGGGALQRTIVPEGRRRALSTSRATGVEEKKVVEDALDQIDHKKEELYNLIAGVETTYGVHGRRGRLNNFLLDELAVQVKPRPNDVLWHKCRRAQRFDRLRCHVGGCAISVAVAYGLCRLADEVNPDIRPKAAAWLRKNVWHTEQHPH